MNIATAQLRSSPGRRRPLGWNRSVREGAGEQGHSNLVRRFWRGPAEDPRWARPAFLGLLAITAVAYFYNLTASGYANSFYSAAAQAGSQSWKAFFYGSSDAANSITVDKPPASLWAMALSVRVFGLNSFAILLPQVLMGLATVGVLYATVRRHFGAVAGLLSAAVMALTPVAVLMFRFNNPDALLVLLMTLGAWATLRAVESGSARWMALAGVFIGLGFLTKTLQVLLVVPFFGIAYLVAARTGIRRRMMGALAGIVAMVLSAGWWVAIVELVPASMRPYIGGSQDNSFLSLTFGYNGFGRLNGNETGSVGGGPGGGAWGSTGIDRMFNTQVGGQISWLLPAALVLLAAGLVACGRAPRTDLRRAAYLVWGGWLLVTALTFSFMAGIFHEYYTVALAPAIAALVGMGGAHLWQRRAQWWARIVLAATVVITAAWAYVLLDRTTAYGAWLRIAIVVLGALAAAGVLLANRLSRRLIGVTLVAALVAGLAGPAAFSATTLQAAHEGSIVTAGPPSSGGFGPGRMRTGRIPQGAPPSMPNGPDGFTGPGGPNGGAAAATGAQPGGGRAPGGVRPGGMGGLLTANRPSTAVVTALQADADRFTWAAATVGSQNAAGLQLGSGEPVMAIGGFNGSDPSPTLAQFKQYVAQGRIHYFLAGGMGGGRMGGTSTTAAQITSWVQSTYSSVTVGGQTFYDLTAPISAE